MRVVPYSEIYDDDPDRQGSEPGLFEAATGIYDIEREPAREPEPPSSTRIDAPSRLDATVQRAVGEQLAEQRMVKGALTDVGERLRMLERSVAERLVELEGEVVDRLTTFERSVTDRMLAFETVLECLVDRLGAAETRIVEGLDHNDRMARAQLEALRPSLEAAFERVMDVVESTSGRAPPVEPLIPPEPPEPPDVEAAIAKAMKSATAKLQKSIEAALADLAPPEPPEPAVAEPIVVETPPVVIDAEPVQPKAQRKKTQRKRPLRAR